MELIKLDVKETSIYHGKKVFPLFLVYKNVAFKLYDDSFNIDISYRRLLKIFYYNFYKDKKDYIIENLNKKKNKDKIYFSSSNLFILNQDMTKKDYYQAIKSLY